jgi:transcription antitermination protein NusB
MTVLKQDRVPTPRSAARLFAVQALYQHAMDGGTAARLITEFTNHRLRHDVDGVFLVAPDDAFFADVVAGALARTDEINTLIAAHLAQNWTAERVDTLIMQVLRAGVYELIARPDVPTAVIINEYVDVAGAFVERVEQGFVNGVLDRIARTLGRKKGS